MLSARYRFAWAALAPAAVVFALACSSSTKGKGPGGAQDEWSGEARETEIKHENCDPAGKEARTFKGDSNLAAGKSYVTRVYVSSREVCSFSDLNGDGNVDLYTFYGDDGKIRRRESAYTVSKQIDEIAIYQNGDLQVVMRETNFDGKLDTWDYYESGKLVRRERDKTGDGRIDVWWTFQAGTDNATIVQADPRSGKPDPTSTVTLGTGAGSLGGIGAKPTATAMYKDSGAPEAAAPASDAGSSDAKGTK
jgi:hypothetical protein